MSMADRARMNGLEERIAALEVSKFKERLDVLEAGISVMKEARASGWTPQTQAAKAGVALENEVRVLRARMEKLEKTL